MRYDYRCDACQEQVEVEHGMQESPCVPCPACKRPMRRVITAPKLQFTRWGNRSVRSPDRPSNAEYQAFKAWEREGRPADTDSHKKFLDIKGEL